MSFNTSNISCDTLSGIYSITAPIHYVDGIPISKNNNNLKLGDNNNAVVECLELEANTQISAPLAVLDAISTGEIIPSAGTGNDVLVDGNLNLQSYAIKNLDVLTLAGGATGSTNQVLAVGATGSLFWKNDSNDVSLWSEYPALQNVDMNNFDLNNVDSITSASVVVGTGATGSFTQSMVNVGGINLLQFNPSSANMGIYLNNNTAFFMPNGSFQSKNMLAEKMTLTGMTGAVMNVSSAVNGTPALYLDNDINTLSSQSDLILSGFGNISCAKVLPTYKLNTDYYVSSNGDDTNGNGSMDNPYLTIQHAIDVCEALTQNDNIYRYIHIMGGNYTENLAITKKVFLVGESQGPYSSTVGCCINGNVGVVISANGNDMFNNCCNIQNLLINGKITFSSSQNSMLNIENSYIYTPDDSAGGGVYFTPACANSRLRMWNTQVISGGATGTDPLVELNSVGQLVMNNCYLSAKGLQNCLKFSGTATCDTIANCKFECSSSSASVLPLVEITATVSGTYSFGVCAFFYSSSTSKSGNANACGILNNNASGNNNILINYCSFFLLGTTSQANYAVQDANYGTGTAMAVLYYMNNASLTNAFSIHATQNVNKFQLTVVS